MTYPGSPSDVEDSDRAEQETFLDLAAVTSADMATAPEDDVPEVDALEQQISAQQARAGSPQQPVGDREADDADVLEQEAEVSVDDDDVPH